MSHRESFKLVDVQGNVLYLWRNEGPELVRLFILEEAIFRVLLTQGESMAEPQTWAIAPGLEDLPFEGRDRLDLSPFALPPFNYREEDGILIVETTKLRVEINLSKLHLTWYVGGVSGDQGWRKVAEDRRTQAYNMDHLLGEGIAHYLRRDPSEKYFGLGEKSGNLDRHGRRYRMLNIDAMGYDAESGDPLYKHIPFYITYQPSISTAYGLFYDNLSSSVFDMGKELDNYHGCYRYYRAERPDLDYYFLAGPRVKHVVRRYAWLTGKMALPPRWSLGYSGSTMHYTDAPDAQDQLQRFIEDRRANDIPCDSFHLSSGYTTIGDKRYVFNWDTEKIPEPRRLVEAFHEDGLKLVANIKPCLLLDHPDFAELQKAGMFVKDRYGEKPAVTQFWDAEGANLDFTNPLAIRWWKERLKERLLNYGIDSTWNDNNEYEIWDGEALINGFGDPRTLGHLRPVMPLLMTKASRQAQVENAAHQRPYLITRSGCPGIQRYAQTWSGDNFTSWKTLRYNTRMGVGMSLSGLYNFGHDVGGFSGPAPGPELLVRWVQNGCLHPRFTIHSWNDDGTTSEPWMYPDATKAIRKAIRLRYYLLPYLYRLLYEAHARYEPMVRPAFYDNDNDPRTFEESDNFLLGQDLLVASVVEPGARSRLVYLPHNGTGWFDFHSGQWFDGGQEIKLDAPLDRLPFLARAGSMVPVDRRYSEAPEGGSGRRLLLYPAPDEGQSSVRVLEDDGTGYGYLTDNCAWLWAEIKTSKEDIQLLVRREGKEPLPYSSVEVVLPPDESRLLHVGGLVLDPTRDGRKVTLEIES